MRNQWTRWQRWLAVALGFSVLALLLLGGVAYYLLHIPHLPLPPGVQKQTHQITLTGKPVNVDFYLPAARTATRAVVIAHGFSRNRKTMAGWGAMLAAHGFLAVVPDAPTLADHSRNGRALVELLRGVQEGKYLTQPQPEGTAALVGFSAGGLSSLLAAGNNTNVTCWIGLDAVAFGPAATRAARSLHYPCFALCAEPGQWNANGIIRSLLPSLPDTTYSLTVKHATHVDGENPTSHAANLVCGQSDPARRAVFGRYLLAAVQAGLLGDELAWQQLRAATNDPTVRDVILRNQ